MVYSNSLASDGRSLVLDTSVLINLHGCTLGEPILEALPNNILVAGVVVEELESETSRRNGEHSFLNKLIGNGKVERVELTKDETSLFQRLVAGSSSLDDGEAATIAVAYNRQVLPVVDERRGRNWISESSMTVPTCWSLDLLLHPQVKAALGAARVVEAVYLALRNARMRVPDEFCDDVVALIGEERAIECNCLPGYKRRKQAWESRSKREGKNK